MWAYYCPDEVTIHCNEKESSYYSWGNKGTQFHYCNYCACITHYLSTDKCRGSVLAVNVRMMDPVRICKIPIRNIDGASY